LSMKRQNEGTMRKSGTVLVIRRISVRHKLRASQDLRETIERVHAIHAELCPGARSIPAANEIRTSFELGTS
jgi:hypothetical protein